MRGSVGTSLALASTRALVCGPAPAARASAEAAPFVVALDPGHGGSNLGTVVEGGPLEKDVTLALARRLGAGLETGPDAPVLIGRDKGGLLPFPSRSLSAAH